MTQNVGFFDRICTAGITSFAEKAIVSVSERKRSKFFREVAEISKETY
jgi:hypothetical protein